MTVDPHSAFQALINAWEEFHSAVIDTEDGDAPRVLRASDRLADAYTMYDDILFTTYGVEAPFDTYDDSESDDESYEDDDIDFDDEDVEDYVDDSDDDFDSDYESDFSSDSAHSADY